MGLVLLAALLVQDSWSWAGANCHDLWNRPPAEMRETLALMRASNLRTVRLWINAQGNVKDVEDPVGVWHDEILEKIDFTLAECAKAGVRVILVFHDHWALGRWQTDAYARKWKEPLLWPPGKHGKDDPGGFSATTFYTNPEERAAFRARIAHVLSFRGPYTGMRWSELGDVILAWEPQNEPNWRARKPWTEETAAEIKRHAPKARVAAGGVNVFLRGGADLVKASPSVDYWGYHWYGWEPLDRVAQALDETGRPWFIEEFGAVGGDPALRTAYKTVLAVAREHRVPWMFWRLGRGPGPRSFDLWKGSPLFDEVVVPAAGK
ncbi:MAG: hypothetical protein HYY17_16600 [Planctomycetes bacterium]|nr:hypothetical protein [Planctomycetota bacterium]